MTELAQPRAPRSGRGPRRLSRAQAVGELAERWRDGDHVTAIGPTGRGKSTLIGQLVPACRFDRVVILTPKGPDRAYRQLGVVTRRPISYTSHRPKHSDSEPVARRVQCPNDLHRSLAAASGAAMLTVMSAMPSMVPTPKTSR